MFSRRVFRFALLAALFALTLTAQTGSGRVQGTVKDSSGASIPGATVTLNHTATARQYTTTTNSVGLFLFPPVQPGNYEITVQSQGMETWKGTFLLEVGQTAEISPTLKVGAVTTQVTVAGEVAPLVPTSDPTISRTLEQARMNDLPSDGRSIANLVMLETPTFFGGQDGNINPIDAGMRDAVELYQDGAVIKNRDVGDWSGRLMGEDSVQEIRVESTLSSAQFERPGSVILSTKSGTNSIHGSLFETLRDSSVGVARKRTDVWTKAPHYVRNEPGGSVGGPVWIPKLYNGKNKTFFFTSFEQQRIAQSSTNTSAVATDAMRQGNFSNFTDTLGRYTQLYDPLSTGPAPNYVRTPFAGNIIPQTRESPNAKYLYSIMPEPFYTNINPYTGSNYYGVGPNFQHDWMSTSRIDHRIGDRDQIFGRVSRNVDNYIYLNGLPTLTPYTNSANMVLNYYGDTSIAGEWNHSFSPTFLSQMQVSWSREYKFTGSPSSPDTGNLADYLGMPNIGGSPLTAYQTSGVSYGSYSVQQARQNTTNIYLFTENLTKMVGKHQLQFGGQVHWELLNVWIDQPTCTISYDSQPTALLDPSSVASKTYTATNFTGNATASFFMGYVGTFKQTTKRPAWDLQDKMFSGYFQDNWKATPRLTLNLGLRYENMPPESIDGNYTVGYDQTHDKMIIGRSLADMETNGYATPTVVSQLQAVGAQFETADQAGLPAGQVYGNPWLFAPRAGFAYRVGDNVKPLMLRGGLGLYDAQSALRTWDNLTGSGIPYGYPLQYSVNNTALVGAVPGVDGYANLELRQAPTYIAGVNTRNVLSNPAFVSITPGCCALQFDDPNQHPTRDTEWNFSIGREILAGTVVTASVVGTHAWNIPQNVNINGAPGDYVWYTNTGGQPLVTGTYSGTFRNALDTTTYGSITEYMTRAYSNANLWTLEAERRYAHGYGFQLAYVMSNAFTESTLVGNGGGTGVGPVSTYLTGTVPTDFDARNRFLNYVRDTAIPKHQVRWNWVMDLPFGRGHLLASHAGKILNGVIGGWQIAGTGNYQSRWWSPSTSNYGYVGPVQVYGKQYFVHDCTNQAKCVPEYLYSNGYISPPLINRTDASGNCNGICGIPSSYTPESLPLITYGQTALPAHAPSNTVLSTYWETNNVWIPLTNGTVVRTGYGVTTPIMNHVNFVGPWSFTLNASAFKVFNITEAAKLRFNADFFNVLNNPGLGLSQTYLNAASNSNGARFLQLTLRLTW
ncbi:MAG: TonB-dependent receptor [Bryobacteraceae bacterium]|jgi:hypothetical protein